jgi:hypothetical protein
MGLTPLLPGTRGRTGLQTGAVAVELDGHVELVFLSVKQRLRAAACWVVTGPLRSALAGYGTFCLERLQSYGREAVDLRGQSLSLRRNRGRLGSMPEHLGLVPLRLEERGLWNPEEH